MREDMAKVLVERPRMGGHTVKKTKPNVRDFDDLPLRESTARNGPARGYSGKQLNENLAPLRRWLFRQAGRPWDKVYAEIRKVCGKDNTTEAHIYGHLYSYVDRHPRMTPAGPMKISSYSAPTPYTTYDLYVHPETGLLCQGKEPHPMGWRRRTRRWRRLDPVRLVVKHDGRYWLCRVRPLPTTKHDHRVSEALVISVFDKVKDELTGKMISRETNGAWMGTAEHENAATGRIYDVTLTPSDFYGDACVYAYEARPATSKEIKRAGW